MVSTRVNINIQKSEDGECLFGDEGCDKVIDCILRVGVGSLLIK